MAGQGILGRQVVYTIGGQSILGINTKGLTVNGEPVDVTDDNSDGWQELLATPGVRNAEITASLVVKNLEMLRAIMTNDSQMYAFTGTYPDGSSVAGNAFFANYSETGETAEAYTADVTFQLSGKPTFTAGSGGQGS